MPSTYPTEVLSTRKRGSRAQGVPSPVVLMLSPLPRRWVRLTPDYHLSDPVASLTSKSICCSHLQRCGTALLFRSPCLHSCKIGRVATYTVIVCQRTVMYSSSVPTKYSRPWHTWSWLSPRLSFPSCVYGMDLVLTPVKP